MSKSIKSLLIVLMMSLFSITVSIPAYASQSVSCSSYYSSPTNSNQQWRFIKVVKDPRWTRLATVEGQPTRGTYLKKGDSLFYGESGGNSVSVSFGVGLGVEFLNASASVSFDVPIGKAYNSYYGKSLVASRSGYYLIKAKKYIKPTITFIQYRYRENGKWSLKKPSVYSKKYKVIRAYSTLVRQ